ncbi:MULTISPECIES: acyl carrier protein [Streptomyces]|uniref:Acyl carrier protein n=1 Tax=Streptomyces sviceus (strain ATCC 29083 / DSM 924 / JCM 4929 / NBRC 13980 / NCIMB 11184 / NRRL 5439 / UC 5370) TaxID=463191 RepID=B5HRS6_STRX2|nr:MULTISPECIES: acyl carrier protein [Streptomyces]EDY55531.2 acyl carrier protein [Streptomyces sviceus ATCC 29083]MYT03207.1 acyl carrier protein [Streptomyces sp. SID5470]
MPQELSLDRDAVATVVKKVVIAESRLSLPPDRVSDDEPLVGDLLNVNSLGFVGMLVRIEDELDVTLPDDLFVGRSFRTVRDLIDVVTAAEVRR